MGYWMYLLAVLVGVATGVVTSLMGASGVMVVVPILTILFGVDTHSAIGTSLFVDVAASLTVSYHYYKNGNVDIKSSVWIALAAVAGSQLGTVFAHSIDEGPLAKLFGLLLIVTGAGLLAKNLKKGFDTREMLKKRVRFHRPWQQAVLAVVIGAGVGINSGLFGAGGGVTILLVLVVILQFPLHRAVGTSTLIMAATALSSAVGYGLRGNINLPLGCLLSAGAVSGGMAGARFANKVNERTLEKAISLCFIVLGILMTYLELKT